MSKIIKDFHSNKSIKEQYITTDDGVRNGLSRTWHINGILETECNYVDGKIVGYKTWYKEDGSILKRNNYDFDGNVFEIGFVPEGDMNSLLASVGISETMEDLTAHKLIEVTLMSKMQSRNLSKALDEEKIKTQNLENELNKLKISNSISKDQSSDIPDRRINKISPDDLLDPRKTSFT